MKDFYSHILQGTLAKLHWSVWFTMCEETFCRNPISESKPDHNIRRWEVCNLLGNQGLEHGSWAFYNLS